MRAWVAIVAVAALVWLGCPGQLKPCVNCPPVQGNYDLVAGDPDSRDCLDGGTVGSGELVLNQVNANLKGTFATVDVTGVVYQSQQLSVSGAAGLGSDRDGGVAGLESLSLFGRFVPGNASAPDTIVGDLTVNYRREGGEGGGCSVVARFNAARK